MKNTEQLSIEIAKAIQSRIGKSGYSDNLEIAINDNPDIDEKVKLDTFEGTMCLLELINDILETAEA